MAYYETKKEILEAFAKKKVEDVRPKLYWPPPYDDSDLKELLARGGTSGKKYKKRKHQISRNSEFPTLDLEKFRDITSDILKFASEVRLKLGISSPIKLEEIKDSFLKLGWTMVVLDTEGTSDETATYFPYLKMDAFIEGYRICEVGYIGVIGQDNTQKLDIFYLQSAVSYLSYLLNVHPAVALAVILSSLSDFPSVIEAIKYTDGGTSHIWVNVFSSITRPKAVSAIYSAARTLDRPRYRAPAERTSTLLQFVAYNKELRWIDLLEKWNKEKSSQQYKDINSMRTTYYRAKRKWQKDTK